MVLKKEIISVEFKYVEYYEQDLRKYIEFDSAWVPNMNTIEEKSINGKKWIRMRSTTGNILYYYKDNNSIYGIEIIPLKATNDRLFDTYMTLEGNLLVINNGEEK